MDASQLSGMRSPLGSGIPQRSPIFIKTEAFTQVKDAVDSSKTPVLVLGGGGSGKTTLLIALAEEWTSTGRKCIFLSLYEYRRDEDFLLLLRRALTNVLQLPRIEESDFIAGSSCAGLRATIDLIESASSDLLLIFDGLEMMANQTPVIQLLEQMRRSVRTRVVASSRVQRGFSTRLFRYVIEVQGFTQAEVAEFVRQVGGPALSRAEFEFVTQASKGLPLETSLLLELVRREGIPSDVRLKDLNETLVMRLVRHTLSNVDPDKSAEQAKALTSLALLNRPVRASEYPATTLLNIEGTELLTVSTDSGLAIVHPLVGEAILFTVGLTADSSDHTLSSLEFGAEEAERDALLSDSFIALPEFADVRAGKKNIVIGDRGTGKSAMFAHLSTPNNGGSTSRMPLAKPLTHPADMLRRLEANGSQLSTADQFRAGWLTLVAYCVADQVKVFSSTQHARAALYLKEMLGEEAQTGWMLFKFIKGIGERVLKSSVKIKLGPVEIEPAGKPGAKGASPIELREFIKDAATSLAASGQIALVPLDRIDEIYKYDRDLQQKAVQGLFLGGRRSGAALGN